MPALKAVAFEPADTAPVGLAQRIAASMRGFSLEATRLDDADLDAIEAALPRRTRVYLPAVAYRPLTDMIEPAARLRAAGFEPVPHLAVRGIESVAALDDLLSRLAAEGGVRRVLAIAGDRDRPLGPFASALDVIESGLLQRYGIVEVGIAGYPEGHPRIAAATLDKALAAKVEAATQTGLAVHIVTQFGFDAAIVSWLARLRDLGIEQPVRVGMAGPASVSTLLRYAQRCGVRASAHSLMHQGGLAKHRVGASAPDGLIRALAQAAPELEQDLGQVTPHLLSFGGVGATARWAAAAAAGRIALDRADGFRVEPP